ncbi:CAT RNA binding domain-containing protein [Paenibacillus sp. 8b26]|uniref:CAT RNA binding domain-containing protein n=1 Tax=Paenibacillus sp. 8b26 TaxID=3424133 RepID=UPI003D64A7DE
MTSEVADAQSLLSFQFRYIYYPIARRYEGGLNENQKNFNNNVILLADEHQNEMIVMGKGRAFGAFT